MTLLFVIFGSIILIFGFVLLFGAPYLPTRRREAQVALEMLGLRESQTLFELGCGDGRIMRQAAEKGLKVVGYEMNPVLALVARLHTWRYRKSVRVNWGNFWKADLSEADGIFVFLLDRFMVKLDKKVDQEAKKPIKLVSYAFKIPGKKEAALQNGMYLYAYK